MTGKRKQHGWFLPAACVGLAVRYARLSESRRRCLRNLLSPAPYLPGCCSV